MLSVTFLLYSFRGGEDARGGEEAGAGGEGGEQSTSWELAWKPLGLLPVHNELLFWAGAGEGGWSGQTWVVYLPLLSSLEICSSKGAKKFVFLKNIITFHILSVRNKMELCLDWTTISKWFWPVFSYLAYLR